MADRPCVYVHADHNADPMRTFYEIPDALAQRIQPKGDRRTFVQCLADRVMAAHGHDVRLKCYPEFGCQVIEARAERIVAAAREVVDALNFYESTLTQAYRNEQRPHVMDACRRLREALDG